MMIKKWIFGISIIWLSLQTCWGDAVKVPRAANDMGRLPDLLLNAALERGGQYHVTYPYGSPKTIPLSRRINGVENGELDIFAALSTPEYEQNFIPIYIPLYRGMMGMRLAMIKKTNKDIFKNVNTLDDLRKFSAGQGTFWADSNILEYNALPLVKSLKYINLFRMLEADRFDYFPRGIQEPWAEINTHKNLNLTVDPHIMLWYKAPFYFFVSKSNPKLAQHITEQLEAMISEGSFMQIFYRDPQIKKALQLAHIENRKILKIKNPFISDKTPTHRKELWYTPNHSNTDESL